MTGDRYWLEDALPRYFAGDLDRVEARRFERMLETSTDARHRFGLAWDERSQRLGPLVLLPSDPSLGDCFSMDTLHKFASGCLATDNTELVRSHLGCVLCREQVDALSPSPSPSRLRRRDTNASALALDMPVLAMNDAGTGLSGADANRDGLVFYGELELFVHATNRTIASERYKPGGPVPYWSLPHAVVRAAGPRASESLCK